LNYDARNHELKKKIASFLFTLASTSLFAKLKLILEQGIIFCLAETKRGKKKKGEKKSG